MASKCPCKDCTRRKLYCHSKCPDYDKYKQERENKIRAKKGCPCRYGLDWFEDKDWLAMDEREG